MRGRAKIACDIFVASRALVRADKLSAGNSWRRHDRAICFETAAGKTNQRKAGASTYRPEQMFALPVNPSSKPRMSHRGAVCRKKITIDYAFLRTKFGSLCFRSEILIFVARYSVGDLPDSFLKTRLNCDSD